MDNSTDDFDATLDSDDLALAGRLGSLGAQPIPAPVASSHLTAMGQVAGSGRVRGSDLRTKLKVGAAFLAGILIGGTGLASAGALPNAAQGVAHDVLAQVGVEVPDKKPRSTEGCDGVEYKNHGDFVSSTKAEGESSADAAKVECGKPIAGKDSAPGQADKADKPDKADNPCKPPWAGGGQPAWAGLPEGEADAAKSAAKDSWEKPADCALDDAERDSEAPSDEDVGPVAE